MNTKIHSNYYSEVCINLLISQLQQMNSHSITIEQFHQVVNQIQQLHKIQVEIIDIEENLDLPYWNGDYTIQVT